MILGISGKKQSGKNTACNFIAGHILSTKTIINNGPLLSWYRVDDQGRLRVPAQVSETETVDGIFDMQTMNPEVVNFCNQWIYPHVKVYSFAHYLKQVSCSLFGLSPELVYGNDEQKNQPCHIPRTVLKTFGKKKKIDESEPEFLTVREFLQFLGTDICRRIYEPIWCQSTMNLILAEQPEVSLVCDVRFESEVKAIQEVGGKVIRLTRDVSKSSHESEIALDNYDKFDFVIDNQNLKIEQTGDTLIKYAIEQGALS